MFGRLATIRIKAAEDALAAGRLNEALATATTEELGGHGRVNRLLRKLTEAFLERGQEHLLSERFSEAMADFERAGRCGHSVEKVRQWRQRAGKAIDAARHDAEARAAALGEAQQRIMAGSLGGAADALDRAPENDPKRNALSDAIRRQTRRAEASLAAATAAMKAGDLAAAATHCRAARELHGKMKGLSDVESRLVDHVVTEAREAFRVGRLDRARQVLDSLGEVGPGHSERAEVVDALRLAGEAAAALQANRYSQATVLLGRIARISPKAGWVADARAHIKTLEEHRRSLLEGPLGLMLGPEVSRRPGADAPAGDETLPARAAGHAVIAPPPAVRAAWPAARGHDPLPGLARRLVLRIDGVGSFLLLRGDRIGIGRGGPGATAELPLLSDLSERQAEIVRAGEDYFVVSQSGVELAGDRVDHALLQDGDRVRLGKRIRLRFRRPSLKSSAAALDLGEGVRTETDCRRVLLWSGPILLGSTRECHVHLASGQGDFVMVERGGRMYVKPMGPGGTATPVAMGEQMDLGGFRFSVTEWADRSGTGRVVG